MKTLVGLGNPGAEYEGTRHNIGRDMAAYAANRFDFGKLEESKKYLGISAKGSIEGETALILLPETFMNKSGKVVGALAPKPKDLIVIHDDADLELGTVKVSFAKNSAGHKGVESIMRALKTKEFWRIRIGIQPRPATGKKRRVPAEKLVLQKFSPAERLIVKKIEKKIIEALEKPLTITTIAV